MGCEQFFDSDDHPLVEEAFSRCVDKAHYDYGHLGYTGTIAEKGSYVVIQKDALPIDEARALARTLIAERDPRIDDKWGPAGAIPILPVGWFFFGWASS